MQFLTMGYGQNVSAEQVIAYVRQIDAVLLDIRMMPYGRPEFHREVLQLNLGALYRHLPQWGNCNYRLEHRGRGIKIADFEAGLEVAQRFAAETGAQWQILLCGCASFLHCHRATVADLLHAHGHSTQEIDWSYGR